MENVRAVVRIVKAVLMRCFEFRSLWSSMPQPVEDSESDEESQDYDELEDDEHADDTAVNTKKDHGIPKGGSKGIALEFIITIFHIS